MNIAIGSVAPRNTNVLHIQANPAAEHFALRRQELDRLKGENSALLRRLRNLEDQRGVQEDEQVVPRKSWDNVSAEKMELNEVLKQKELRLLRLQQVRLPRL